MLEKARRVERASKKMWVSQKQSGSRRKNQDLTCWQMTPGVISGNRWKPRQVTSGSYKYNARVLKSIFDLWGLLDFCLGLRVYGAGFRVGGLLVRIDVLGVRVWGVRLMIEG